LNHCSLKNALSGAEGCPGDGFEICCAKSSGGSENTLAKMQAKTIFIFLMSWSLSVDGSPSSLSQVTAIWCCSVQRANKNVAFVG
jgi:hypothetical protein